MWAILLSFMEHVRKGTGQSFLSTTSCNLQLYVTFDSLPSPIDPVLSSIRANQYNRLLTFSPCSTCPHYVLLVISSQAFLSLLYVQECAPVKKSGLPGPCSWSLIWSNSSVGAVGVAGEFTCNLQYHKNQVSRFSSSSNWPLNLLQSRWMVALLNL